MGNCISSILDSLRKSGNVNPGATVPSEIPAHSVTENNLISSCILKIPFHTFSLTCAHANNIKIKQMHF